jgi:hypothetical protein
MKQSLTFPMLLAAVFLISTLTGCKTTETNPCEGLLSESPPTRLFVKFIDKQNNETLIMDASVIKVTEKKSGNPYVHWNIYNSTDSFPLNGAISLAVFQETPGEYQYDIQMGEAGMVTLSYQVSRQETDNPCRPFEYPMHDIKIVNQPFDIFQSEGKAYPKVLIVKL